MKSIETETTRCYKIQGVYSIRTFTITMLQRICHPRDSPFAPWFVALIPTFGQPLIAQFFERECKL